MPSPFMLLTGFEPFGGDAVNPSDLAARALHDEVVGGLPVRSVLLPVDTARAPHVLREALADGPSAVLLTGLAAGRPQVALERVALNVLDFRLPDNAGVTKQDEPVVPGGPDAYLSTLPLRAILAAWRAAGVPGYISDTAGLYLCNQVMYTARHALGEGVPCGFLHLPANEAIALSARAPGPYLPQGEIDRAVRVALEA
ncbi:pyrrolidone-carboxylate peptidase, partial [Deinococcus pimensis]|uniref:pyroglutamyl-peptidase I family protein n=1 Tax=Deinococcus pimensis TaxID=309888 RepID=UPI0005EB0C24